MATNYTIDANCQAAWLFDDNLNDSAGKCGALDASAAGSATYTAADKPAVAYVAKAFGLFNGSSEYLFINSANLGANFPGKASLEAFSVCFWMRLTANVDPSADVIGVQGAAGYSWDLYTDTSDDWKGRIVNAGTENILAQNTNGLNDTSWHHWVFVFNHANTGHEALIFRDGNATPHSDDAVTKASCGSGTEKFTLATVVYVDKGFCPCLFAEVGVFDKALSTTEIAEIYASGLDGGGVAGKLLAQLLNQ